MGNASRTLRCAGGLVEVEAPPSVMCNPRQMRLVSQAADSLSRTPPTPAQLANTARELAKQLVGQGLEVVAAGRGDTRFFDGLPPPTERRGPRSFSWSINYGPGKPQDFDPNPQTHHEKALAEGLANKPRLWLRFKVSWP